MGSWKIAVLPGDGIGPEITAQAVRVLKAVGGKFGHSFELSEMLFGGCSTDAFGRPLTEETLQCCKASDAVLLGSVGGPKWDSCPRELRPERGLLALRAGLGLFANLRPARLHPLMAHSCPLRPEIAAKGIDLMTVRELTGGIYFGEHKTEGEKGERVATDILRYSEAEIDRILRVGFETAMKRRKKLTSVEKSNVLDSSRLWKERAHEIAKEYPGVELSDMLVDNAAMQLVKAPYQFDVIVTENMFGDILSDEAGQIAGSIGMTPSASLRGDSLGLFEPIHGSAPDIAGQDIANPIGSILSAAMLLRYSLGLASEAEAIEAAVDSVLNAGLRTADIFTEGCKKVGCAEMGEAIAKAVEN